MMAAQYNVEFRHKVTSDYEGAYVHSADTRSTKPADVRLAYRKARDKAKAALTKRGLKARDYTVTSCRCVG